MKRLMCPICRHPVTFTVTETAVFEVSEDGQRLVPASMMEVERKKSEALVCPRCRKIFTREEWSYDATGKITLYLKDGAGNGSKKA